MEYPVAAREPFVNNHSHQFKLYSQEPKPIDVDGVMYMPGVYECGTLNEDWAALYRDLGGES